MRPVQSSQKRRGYNKSQFATQSSSAKKVSALHIHQPVVLCASSGGEHNRREPRCTIPAQQSINQLTSSAKKSFVIMKTQLDQHTCLIFPNVEPRVRLCDVCDWLDSSPRVYTLRCRVCHHRACWTVQAAARSYVARLRETHRVKEHIKTRQPISPRARDSAK